MSGMRSLQKKVLILAMAGISAILFFRLEREWRRAPAFADIPSYRRVDWWILSARCAQWKRVVLVACGAGGELYPIEDVSPTDDRGHTLFLDGYALLKSGPVTRTDLVRMNILLNIMGGLVLAAFLGWLGMPWAACGTLAACVWLFPFSVWIAGPDVPSAFLGIFSLAAIPALGIGSWLGPFPVGQREWGTVWIGGCALVMSVLFREAIGLSGILAAVTLLLWRYFKIRTEFKKATVVYGLLLLGMGAASQSTSILLTLRNKCVKLPPARLIESHGVAHMFYQGLGAVPNPWGISYGHDEDGYNAVRKINPAAGYGTPQYYHDIGNLYMKIVTTQPCAVMRIYMKKLWITLTLPLKIFGVPYRWILLLETILILIGWRSVEGRSMPLSAATSFGIYLIVFLSQGIFITPEMRFLYPAKFGVLVLFSLFIDSIFCKL